MLKKEEKEYHRHLHHHMDLTRLSLKEEALEGMLAHANVASKENYRT